MQKKEDMRFATMMGYLFFGFIGVHRLINKKFLSGFLMMITLGGFGIWYFYDGYLLLTNQFMSKDNDLITYKGKFFDNTLNIATLIIMVVVFISAIRLILINILG